MATPGDPYKINVLTEGTSVDAIAGALANISDVLEGDALAPGLEDRYGGGGGGGSGVPDGGTTNQALVKLSGDDGDADWSEIRRTIVVPTDSLEGTGFTGAIETIDVQYVVDSETSPDLQAVQVDGTVRSWSNEWGALRGTSPYGWGDALVRGVIETTDVINEGNAFEIVDRNLPAGLGRQRWGRQWTTGALVRNGIVMNDVIILTESETIPADLPSGTVIVRIED
jgi:hypothetical protein